MNIRLSESELRVRLTQDDCQLLLNDGALEKSFPTSPKTHLLCRFEVGEKSLMFLETGLQIGIPRTGLESVGREPILTFHTDQAPQNVIVEVDIFKSTKHSRSHT